MRFFGGLFQIFQRTNGHTVYEGFQSGDDHWQNFRCEGSGKPLGFIENGRGKCAICHRLRLRATVSGMAYGHKQPKTKTSVS